MIWTPIGRSRCAFASSDVYDATWVPGTNDILYVKGVELWRMDADTGDRERIPFEVERLIERFEGAQRRNVDRK